MIFDRFYHRSQFDLPFSLTPDGTGRLGSVFQCPAGYIVRIGKSRLVPCDSPNADTLIDGKTSRFDNALFKTPAFIFRKLEVQVGIIDLMVENSSHCPDQGRLIQPEWFEKNRFGQIKTVFFGRLRRHEENPRYRFRP